MYKNIAVLSCLALIAFCAFGTAAPTTAATVRLALAACFAVSLALAIPEMVNELVEST